MVIWEMVYDCFSHMKHLLRNISGILMGYCWYINGISGWWFQPPWNIWKSDWIIIPTIGENISAMFQTANQILIRDFFMGYCWYINGGYCYIIKHPDPSHKPPWTVRRVPDPWPPPGPVKMASCLTQFAATLQTGTPRFASQKWHGKCWKDLERSGNLGDHRTTILETTKRDFSATLCGCCYTRYWWYCQGFMAG